MPSNLSCSNIVAAISSVLQGVQRPVPLHEPYFPGNEKAYVASTIQDCWVSSVGAFVDRFEHDLATMCGAPFAVATASGTAALHVALVALGVKPGDEVLVPSLTFVATANAVRHAGVVPHFVEVEDASLGIDPLVLERYLRKIVTIQSGLAINKHTGRVIRALMPVHVFGHPCQIAALQEVARGFHLVFLEDAAAALGSLTGGKPVGSSGTAAFSFNGNKIITTGGGGAVVTHDEALYRRLKHLTTTAKTPHAWEFSHDEVAWNYRMPNLNAALGCAQLEQLPHFVTAKRALATRYKQALETIPGIRILSEPENTQSNYWLTTLMADHVDKAWLTNMLGALHEAGMLCRPLWTPLHTLPIYSDSPRADLRLTETLSQRAISLPSSVKLGLRYL